MAEKQNLSSEKELNNNEERAQEMAIDLRNSLKSFISKNPYALGEPVQWAVRTSMDEAYNSKKISRRVGVDNKNTSDAYVVVECNIDNPASETRKDIARKFLQIVSETTEKHNIDRTEIRSDQFTPLLRNEQEIEVNALFEAVYFFETK